MNWCPYLTYVWSTKELRKWYDTYGAMAFYNGEAWIPKATRVCPGRYSVKFILAPL